MKTNVLPADQFSVQPTVAPALRLQACGRKSSFAEQQLRLQIYSLAQFSRHLVESLTASHSCIYPVPNVLLDIQLLVLAHVGDLVERQLHDLLHLHSAAHCHHLRHLQLKALYLSYHIDIVLPPVC